MEELLNFLLSSYVTMLGNSSSALDDVGEALYSIYDFWRLLKNKLLLLFTSTQL